MASFPSLAGLGFLVDPTKTKRSEVEAWLSDPTIPVSTASVFVQDGIPHMLVKTPGGFEVHSMEGLTEQALISSVSLDASNDMLLEHLPLFPETAPFRSFTVQVVSPGDVIRHTLPSSLSNHWQICAFTNKGAPGGSNTYFDLTAHPSTTLSGGNSECLTYSCTSLRGAKHTGDRLATHASGDSATSPYSYAAGTARLFHAMSFPKTEGTWWVTGATGYTRTKLRTMGPQMPSIVIVDYGSETMYLLPFSIQEAVVGDATFSIGAVTEYVGDNTFVTYALAGQVNVENTNTGDCLEPVKAALRRAVGEAEARRASTSEPAVVEVPSIGSPPVVCASSTDGSEESKASEEESTFSLKGLTVGIQESLVWDGTLTTSPFDPATTSSFFFGRSPHFDPSYTPITPDASSAPVTIPSVFGPCKGGSEAAALLLTLDGQCDTGLPSLDAYQAAWSSTLPVLFLDVYGWSRQVAATRQTVVNGILILKVKNTIDFANRAAREEAMSALNRDAFLLGGPMSMALVEFPCGSRAFYRGVPWYTDPSFPLTLAFGDDVTTLLSNEVLASMASSLSSICKWPIIMAADDTSVYLQGEGMVPYRVAIDRCLASASGGSPTDEEVKALQTMLVSTLNQVSILLQPDALKVIREELLASLNEAVVALETPIKAEMRKMATALTEATTEEEAQAARATLADLTCQKRQVKKRFQPLIDALHAMVSQRASSTRKADLARMVRQSKIASNVAAATTMTPETLREYCEEIEEFVMVTLPDPARLKSLLEATSASTLCHQLASGTLTSTPTHRVAEPKANFVIADGTTVSVLAEIGDGDRGHTLALATGASLALPLSTSARHLSMVPIPILDRYVSMSHPGAFPWVEEANQPQVATYRILLRSLFSQGNASRTVSISPSSKELTFLVIHFFLEVAESLVDRMSAPPAPGDTEAYESTSARILRGLMGLVLTTMGSGASPASSLWQMVMGKPHLKVPDAKEMWILRSLMRVLPYTGWTMEAFNANLKEMVCRMIRKSITGPAVENIGIAATKASTRISGEEAHALRAKLSAWNGVAAYILEAWPSLADGAKRGIATRLMAMAPAMTSEEIGRHQSFGHLMTFFARCCSNEAGMSFSASDPIYLQARDTALGVLLKHGCVMKPFKAAIHDARVAGGDDSEAVAAFVTRMEELKAMRHPSSTTTTIPIRNLHGVLNSKAPLTGDSDLAREPWSVGGAVAPFWSDDEVKRRVALCLGSFGSNSHGASADGYGADGYEEAKTEETCASTLVATVPKVVTILTKAGAKPASQAMRLAEAATGVTPYPTLLGMASKPFSLQAFTDALAHLGVDPAAFQPLVQQMIVTQLEEVHDHDKALAKSVTLLHSFC